MTEQKGKRPELVIALVCPLGVRIQALEDVICNELKEFGYESERIHISKLLSNLDFWTVEPDQTERTRINHSQKLAFAFRSTGGPDALARAAIAEIRERRRMRSGNPDTPAPACAYILRQLKHPKEVELLRRTYGNSVVVVAAHAPEETRISALADEMAKKVGKASGKEFLSDASALIGVDAKEEGNPSDEEAKIGQNTRDTYPQADYFVSLAHGDGYPVREFVQLLFGHPFHSPTPEEMAMYQANAMALRSSDERRQVGAVIVKRTKRSESSTITDADIVASGMNEVPRRQGGYFWHRESPDGRDQRERANMQGDDEDLEVLEDRIKLDALIEIATKLQVAKWLSDDKRKEKPHDLGKDLLSLLKRTQFMDISEFMRQVHAEMAAIVDAAKRGVAVRGTEMYVTTFPCHNCAKHIIAAGITKVIYLEPYSKSRATLLHEDEIMLDPANPSNAGDRVLFVPFTGVAPRQYARLFSMSARSYKNGGKVLKKWVGMRATLSPLYVLTNAAHAYTRTEREELKLLPKEYNWDRATLCPEDK
jgi:deoxycytidylate deaminase